MDSMIFAAVLSSICTFVLISGAILLLYRRVSRRITAYFTAGDENNPSEFNKTLAGIADLFVYRAMASLKASSMQAASVEARAANKEALEAVAGGNPLMAMLPGLMKKNPLAALALPFLAKMGSGMGAATSSAPHPGNGQGQIRFKL